MGVLEKMSIDSSEADVLQQFDSLLSSSSQSWLLGAGTSVDSKIPLMGALTRRVIEQAKQRTDEADGAALESITKELDKDCHIEHILSHLADRRAIAERCKTKVIKFGSTKFKIDELDQFHQRLLADIAMTVRWGFVENTSSDNEIGDNENPVVEIENQIEFVNALLEQRQKNIASRRRPVKFFTTNYDTLIEDALSLKCIPYWDGFEGGAVAYRSHRFGDSEPQGPFRAHVIKLHGSIDWHLGNDGHVWRVRDSDRYPEKSSRVLIYPQAIKYIATQRDPFASQFDLFRRALNESGENVLGICGYSFGDEHINQEIELAMDQPNNKSTILAFSMELNDKLDDWRSRSWGKRLYIITQDGVHVGSADAVAKPKGKDKRDWWKLQGLTRLLVSGPEACL